MTTQQYETSTNGRFARCSRLNHVKTLKISQLCNEEYVGQLVNIYIHLIRTRGCVVRDDTTHRGINQGHKSRKMKAASSLALGCSCLHKVP